ERSMHLYVAGSTGSGKSKFIEYLIRQDVRNWRNSRCGILLLDPHGSVYDRAVQWLAGKGHIYNRPVILIDLRRDDWIVAYNVLRKREAAASVVTDNLVDALAYVWGAGGTAETPRLARTAATVFHTLYEHGLPLGDAIKVLDFLNHDLRVALAESLRDPVIRSNLERLNALKFSEYSFETESTLNRLQRFLRNELFAAIFGQTHVSLDLSAALHEGHIILVSLATEVGKISREDANTFATLLLADLWTAGKERGKDKRGAKPFYVYLDEFQRFVSPTIAENLDEARGFGLHLTLAHQYPSQLIEASQEHGQRLYESILENARNKVVFSLSLRERNLTPLADWLYMGTFDTKNVKHEQVVTKVMGYDEETRTVTTSSSSWGQARSDTRGSSDGSGSVHSTSTGGIFDDGSPLPSRHWGE
ncbi:MAG: type IV secretory system conjugative DNA transfer family protein, partial [Acidimicrobiia bacterium]